MLKCLACGQANQIQDDSCAACGSSLNLKLCPACEAINGKAAARCHSCGAPFGPGARRSAPAPKATPPRPEPRRRHFAAVWILPLALVPGPADHFFPDFRMPAVSGLIVVPAAAPAAKPSEETPTLPVAAAEAGKEVPDVAPSAPSPLSVTHTRTTAVTHTKASAVQEAPAASAPPAGKESISACAPGVAALGLCIR